MLTTVELLLTTVEPPYLRPSTPPPSVLRGAGGAGPRESGRGQRVRFYYGEEQQGGGQREGEDLDALDATLDT